MGRIVSSESCDAAAELLGGYERIDCSLDPIWEAINRNPEGFEKIEADEFCARYVITKPICDLPALIWIFTIMGNGDIIFEHVEVFRE